MMKKITGRDKILEIFQKKPKERYLSEIAKEAKISVERAHTYLKEMSDSGYLLKEKRGNMVFYKLNFDNELLINELGFIELKKKQNFIEKNIIIGKLMNKLVKVLKEKVDELRVIFLFGSVARGEHSEKSDIDVLVVVSKKNENNENLVLETASKVGMQYGREINVSVVNVNEFDEGLKSKEDFYKTFLRDKIIFYGEKWFYTEFGDEIG